MTTTQKIIKYFAVALAVVIIINIINLIAGLATGFYFLFGKEKSAGEEKTYEITGEVNSLEADIDFASFTIETGDAFSVRSNSTDLSVENDGGTLCIKENGKISSVRFSGLKTVLTVPEGFTFEKADIATGVGKVNIDELIAKELLLDLGAGKADIRNIKAETSAKINTGAGKVDIKDGILCNLYFDMGVGKADFNGRITGESKIDCGIGELKLKLTGKKDDYRIAIDNGIGTVKVDGDRMSDGVYGNGDNRITVDGGVGRLKIKFDN